MNSEKIIEQILSSRPNLTQKEVRELIKKKKRDSEELFTDETAARIVASELGLEIDQKPLRLEILIKDLVSGLNDVTVTGRVISFQSPRTYIRKDLTQGVFTRLSLADRSGRLNVILWGEKADLVEKGKFKPGQIIKISHGYVRIGLDGRLELHVGLRGNIQISPRYVEEDNYQPE